MKSSLNKDEKLIVLPFAAFPSCSDGRDVATSRVVGNVDGSINKSFTTDRSTSSGSTK